MEDSSRHIEDFVPVSPDRAFSSISHEDIMREMETMLTPSTQDARTLEANVELFSHTSAIPFQNRYRYFVGEMPNIDRIDKLDFLDADELSAKLGIKYEELLEVLTQLGVTSDMCHTTYNDILSLAPGVDTVVAEELAWRRAYDALADEVTAPVIAGIMGISTKQVKSTIRETGAQYRLDTTIHKPKHLYPKTVMYRIRAELLMFPPARDNESANKIVRTLGYGNGWFASRDGQENADFMRLPSGHVTEVYTPAVKRMLGREAASVMALDETMRTNNAIGNSLGRTAEWAAAKTKRLGRRAVIGRVRSQGLYSHYPDDVYQELRQEAEHVDATPVITDDLVLLEEFAALVGTTEAVVEPVIQSVGIESLERKSRHRRRIVTAYRRSDVPLLAEGLLAARQKRLAEIEKIIETFTPVGRDNLSDEQRVALTWARREHHRAARHVEESEATYQRILLELGAESGEEAAS